jgi:hypothetical protein
VPAREEEHSPDFPQEKPKRPVLIVFGLKPERLVGAEGRIDAVPDPPSAEQAGLLVDALKSGVEAGGTVIAIVPTWFSEDGLKRLEMARTLLDTDRVVIHRTPLPPLAATALASTASSLAPRLPSAGLVASALPGLEEQLHQITWLGSVTGLKHPAPSLGQHVASLTPGSAFAVSSHPQPAVYRLPGQDVPIPRVIRPSRLVVANRNGDDKWLAQRVPLPVLQVEPTPNGPSYWGTTKLAEAVICPSDPDQLANELLQSAESWACRWCGELIARSPCPLCGHRARPRRRQQGARR